MSFLERSWKKNLDDATIARFQRQLAANGCKLLFINFASLHSLNDGMFDLAHRYARREMSAFVELRSANSPPLIAASPP